MATLSKNSSRKLACGQSSLGVEDICINGKPAISLRPRSVYDDLARFLIMIRDRFIDSPDIDEIVIFEDNEIAISKVLQLHYEARIAGFSKVKLAILVKEEKSKKSNWLDPIYPIFRVIDRTALKDSRNREEVMQVVNSRLPELKKIYSSYLKQRPGFGGKSKSLLLHLKFTIAPSGDISSISIFSSTTDNPAFDEEIKAKVSNWKWKPFDGGNTTLIIPFNFSE